MAYVKKMIALLLGVPKTLFLNFYYLPFREAIHIPIIVAANTKISRLGSRSSVIIKNSRKHVTIGFSGSYLLGGGDNILVGQPTYWSIGKSGKLIFNGSANLSRGTQLICDGEMEIGDKFSCNANCILNSAKKIVIKDGCLLGWNCTIIDGDGHSIVYNKKECNSNKDIILGEKVWIAANSTVLKGSVISDHSIVASHAIVSKKFARNHIIIGEYNKILKKDVDWNI